MIYYVNGSSAILDLVKKAGSTVIGLDWRQDLDEAWDRLGDRVAVQGNLDPCTLFLPQDELKKRVRDVLKKADGRPGHIFNLGHGILPPTPRENAIALVEMVHSMSRKMKPKAPKSAGKKMPKGVGKKAPKKAGKK